MKALQDKPTKKKKQASKKEPKQASSEAVQEEKYRGIEKCIKTNVNEFLDSEENKQGSYITGNAMMYQAYIFGTFDSICQDIVDIEKMTDRQDKYALNSLVNTKMKFHKLITEQGKFFQEMVEYYAQDGQMKIVDKVSNLERQLEIEREKNKNK